MANTFPNHSIIKTAAATYEYRHRPLRRATRSGYPYPSCCQCCLKLGKQFLQFHVEAARHRQQRKVWRLQWLAAVVLLTLQSGGIWCFFHIQKISIEVHMCGVRCLKVVGMRRKTSCGWHVGSGTNLPRLHWIQELDIGPTDWWQHFQPMLKSSDHSVNRPQKSNRVKLKQFSTCLTATGTYEPYGITVLPTTWQRWQSRFYPSQLKLVLDLAILKMQGWSDLVGLVTY